MSFKAKLNLGGKEYTVLHASYKLHQEIDATGRPSSQVVGGTIKFTVESTGGSEHFEFMTNDFDRKDGSIVYSKRDTDATLKTVSWVEGYLVKYEENFDSTGTNPLTETLVISAREMTIGNGTKSNKWV